MTTIGIVTGEFSGDKLSSFLIKNIILDRKKIKIIGITGPELEKIKCHSLYSINEVSVFGIVEPILKIKRLIKIKNNIYSFFIEFIDIFIGVDFPGLNLNLEKKIKKNGIFVIHLVSPSIWAWRKYRIKNMKFCFNILFVLFPFEEIYYKNEKIPVKYIGHPCSEIINIKKNKKKKNKKIIITLLPGSRIIEIKNHVPIYEKIVNKFKIYKNFIFVISSVSFHEFKIIKNYIKNKNIKIINKNFYKIINISNIVFSASGTASLESSIIKNNTLIIYKMNKIVYYILKIFIKIKYISLQNIISKKKVHTEYIQKNFNEKNIKNEIVKKKNIILIIKKKYLINKTKNMLKFESKKKFKIFLKNIIL